MPTRRRPVGPLGGKTTHTPGGFFETKVYLAPDDVEKLRRLAYKLRVSQSEVVRRALQAYEPEPEPKK